MSEKLALPTFTDGIIREAAIGQTVVPLVSVELSVNGHFDHIGEWERRKGLTRIGAQAANKINALHSFRNNAGDVYSALRQNDTDIEAFSGSSWSSVRTGLTSGSKARFTNLVDYTFMLNGSSNEVVQSWGGTGSFGSTNVASIPKGDFIATYRNRIWVGDKSTDKIYYTDVVTTSNTITGGTEFLQISPADGQNMTGLFPTSRALVVFKQNYAYRVFTINSVDPSPVIYRGTYSQESIVQAKDGIYYHHPTGFYRLVLDGGQEEISRPIIDIVQAIPRSQYENITSWSDDDHVYWSVGDITIGSVAFSNITIVRTISTQVWTLYSHPNEITSSSLYDDGSTIVQPIVGDESGNVCQFGVGDDDLGTAISYDLTTHWYYLSGVKSARKFLTEIAILHKNATGSNISYQINNDNQKSGSNKWRTTSSLRGEVEDILSLDAQNFTRIRFRLSGNSSGTPQIFRGIELLDLTINDAQK